MHIKSFTRIAVLPCWSHIYHITFGAVLNEFLTLTLFSHHVRSCLVETFNSHCWVPFFNSLEAPRPWLCSLILLHVHIQAEPPLHPPNSICICPHALGILFRVKMVVQIILSCEWCQAPAWVCTISNARQIKPKESFGFCFTSGAQK